MTMQPELSSRKASDKAVASPAPDRNLGCTRIAGSWVCSSIRPDQAEPEQVGSEVDSQFQREFIEFLVDSLRNPLAPIRTGAEIIRRSGHFDPKIQRAAATIERQVIVMARILEEVLQDISEPKGHDGAARAAVQ